MGKKNRFMFLLMLTYLFISTSALAIRGGGINEVFVFERKKVEKITVDPSKFPPIPKLNNTGYYPVVSAQAVYALDLDSYISLYEKNIEQTLLPASTTKIMTALVAFEEYNLADDFLVGKNWVEGQKMGLRAGEKISVGDLMYGLLIYSANDAAETLASNHPKGRNEFISLMNKKAKELHLDKTRFDNPVGFDSDNNFSTARDLVRLTEIALTDKRFSDIVRIKEKTLFNSSGIVTYKLTNTNKLLGSLNGVLGVKTGWTENARENLVTYVERDNRRVLIALLGSQDRFGETKEIIEWIFSSYVWNNLPEPASIVD